jgi:hypothetical protein
MDKLATAQWIKSRASNASGNCVEVATTPTAVGIRDSKNPAQGHFAVTPAAWKAFLCAARNS